jgi:hypothetical protein
MAHDTFSVITAWLTNIAGPIHLFSFSVLLGTEMYQTFTVTKICFRALPRPAFINLQKSLFPVYFKSQVALLVLTALTYPPHGLVSLAQNTSHMLMFAGAGVTAALNMCIYGPRTRQAMLNRVQDGLWKGLTEICDLEFANRVD